VQQHLALVGHNPAFTELINYLAGPGILDNLPTAGWVELSLSLDDWSDIYGEEGKGRLVYRLFPKDLQDGAR
jgi:phosphohistidine phosphatase